MKNMEIDDIVRAAERLSQVEPSAEATGRAIDRTRRALLRHQSQSARTSSAAVIGDDDIIRRAQQLSAIEPTAEAVRRAIGRTREALATGKRGRRLTWVRRLFVPGGIAAAVLVFVGIHLFLPVTPAGAAITFVDVLDAAADYNGWIRIYFKRIPDIIQPVSGPRLTSWSAYVLPASKSLALKAEFEDGTFSAKWWSYNERVRYVYHSRKNEIFVSACEEQSQEDIQAVPGLPLQPDQFVVMDLLRNAFESNACKVTQTDEGNYCRFDVRFVENVKRFTDVDRLSLWVDPDTKLIHRWQRHLKGGTEATYLLAYDIPPLNNIYDLGVPRDAAIIDARPSPDTKALLNRLDSRIGPGENLGNYVAVLTSSTVADDGTLQPENLRLYARTEGTWVYANYWNPEVLAIPSWPLPRVTDVVNRCRNTCPRLASASDGERCWEAAYDEIKKLRKGHRQVRDSAEQRLMSRLYSLSADIWPGRHMYGIGPVAGLDIRLQRLTRPDRTDLIGLRVDRTDTRWRGSQSRPSRRELTFWLDPSRDDVPVETIERYYLSDGTLLKEILATYDSPTQLPNGHWCPRHWNKTTTDYRNNQAVSVRNREYHLQIVPNMVLDESWFTEPAERFQGAE